jgi:hypothetical protein
VLFVAADSHGRALSQGIEYLEPSTRQTLENYFGSLKVSVVMVGYDAYELFFQASPDGISMQGAKGSRLAALTENPRGIFASNEQAFGFCFGLHLFGLHPGLLGSSTRWKSHSLMGRNDRQFVSEAVLKEVMLHHGRYVLQFARLLKHMNVASFFIGPPPVRSTIIESNIGLMTQAEIVQLQSSFWSVMSAALNDIGVPVVLAPAESMTDGVLRPELALDDPADVHHANAEYGSLVWREIAGRVASGNFLGRTPLREDDTAQGTPLR